MTNIFYKSNEGLILSLNSPWGTGKSKFVEMWKNALDAGGEFNTVVLNAWEADYYNDPLIALIMALEDFADTFDNVGLKELRDASGLVFSNLLKKGTFDILDLKEIKQELENEQGAANVKRKFESHKKVKDEIKETLEKLRGGKKVVFFIDELDRAKPNFVVELIELVKHYFKIEGYYFVLLTDRKQFNSIVKHYYGTDIGSDDYLRKIIDLDFSLKQPDAVKYFKFLFARKGVGDIDKLGANSWSVHNEISFYNPPLGLYSLLAHFIKLYKYSLRDVENLFKYIEILVPNIQSICKADGSQQLVQSVLLSYLISVRCKSIVSYQNALTNDSLSAEDFPLSSCRMSSVFPKSHSYNIEAHTFYDIYTLVVRSKSTAGKEILPNTHLYSTEFYKTDGRLMIMEYLDFANQFNFSDELVGVE